MPLSAPCIWRYGLPGAHHRAWYVDKMPSTASGCAKRGVDNRVFGGDMHSELRVIVAYDSNTNPVNHPDPLLVWNGSPPKTPL